MIQETKFLADFNGFASCSLFYTTIGVVNK